MTIEKLSDQATVSKRPPFLFKRRGDMAKEDIHNVDRFQFRNLHPNFSIGTASDRYAGWVGQIYSEGHYKIASRSKTVGGKSFKEETMPVESVEEYFRHFSVLELDFTFYRLLLDRDLKPSPNYHVLKTYQKHLAEGDRLIVKVPQVIFAQRLWRGGTFIENPDYLDPEIFVNQFYDPANDLLGDLIAGFIFEQEYQPKKDRILPNEYVETLDEFLDTIPKDDRYHIETRTEAFLTDQYFNVLKSHGVGQVLSHWTWLPPLLTQFVKSDRRFFNSSSQCIIRLTTPLRMKYDESYKKAYPFDRLIDGMMNPRMIQETLEIILEAIDQGVSMNVIINNRAGGNAPMIAQEIADGFLKATFS